MTGPVSLSVIQNQKWQTLANTKLYNLAKNSIKCHKLVVMVVTMLVKSLLQGLKFLNQRNSLAEEPRQD